MGRYQMEEQLLLSMVEEIVKSGIRETIDDMRNLKSQKLNEEFEMTKETKEYLEKRLEIIQNLLRDKDGSYSTKPVKITVEHLFNNEKKEFLSNTVEIESRLYGGFSGEKDQSIKFVLSEEEAIKDHLGKGNVYELKKHGTDKGLVDVWYEVKGEEHYSVYKVEEAERKFEKGIWKIVKKEW